ncbi:hypothetical protein GCM10011494_38570 [Novosphingobium endophyticum]|uniref:DUF1214 domain-containing protein n=1 Tax=Novosphingobium endophyticum TaxID=1955250 RepID=A0A916TW98_9SPHN|nr:DUF1214 domain-containing protein [Novosphingobium endophyticum]GGC15955.1 hypothetical protein GCM10011494_38570 [Novosphingobium endophyticum]
MTERLSHDIFDHLAPLRDAVAELANTWKPDDLAYRAELYRQAMMNLSYGYFAWFHATPEHPDWAPLWNPVYTLQPNPDDIYLYSPIRGDLSYRVSGNRGTIHILSFTSQHGMSGMVDDMSEFYGHNDIDDDDIVYEDNGDFELLFSAERPSGHKGNWAPIHPEATGVFVRFRSYDWLNEVDPRLSIECLDAVQPKPRLTPDDIAERMEGMAKLPVRKTRLYFPLQNKIKDAVGFNTFLPQKMKGALTKQMYLPAIFQLEDDEALIVETEIPSNVRYWNFQLNDPLFNALEYVYRLSSTNGAMAKLSSDGKFRAVISLTDPGVPNWLDPAGFTEGGIYGRWYEADSCPTPEIKRVKLADLRNHMPTDTPIVTPEERREELSRRVRACQRRRRW